MTSTATNIITRTLKLLGVVGAGQTPSPEDLNDGLDSLNEMLDNWATDQLTMRFIERVVFTSIVAGTATYTIGTGGNINRDNPARIERASWLINTNPSAPFERKLEVINVQKRQAIRLPSTQSNIPYKLYFNPDEPLSQITLYPVPSTGIHDLVLYIHEPISRFADLTTSYDLSKGVLKAIRYNLAIELAPDHEIEPSAAIVNGAMQSLADVRRLNLPNDVMIPDVPTSLGGGHFDWRTGE